MPHEDHTPTDIATPVPTADEPAASAVDSEGTADLLLNEHLIEEISIDGMCGVY